MSKKSLIKQIIKNETDKYFKIEKNLSFGEKLVEKYLNKGFQNISEFKIFLKIKICNMKFLKKN